MSVDLLVNALVTGAAAGLSATASAAVTEAYGAVKDGVRRLFHRAAEVGEVEGDPDLMADGLFAMVEEDPEASQEAVTGQLTRLLACSEVGGQLELMTAARRVLELSGADSRMGKYHVELRDNTGVQVGDHNEMTLDIDIQDRRRP